MKKNVKNERWNLLKIQFRWLQWQIEVALFEAVHVLFIVSTNLFLGLEFLFKKRTQLYNLVQETHFFELTT